MCKEGLRVRDPRVDRVGAPVHPFAQFAVQRAVLAVVLRREPVHRVGLEHGGVRYVDDRSRHPHVQRLEHVGAAKVHVVEDLGRLAGGVPSGGGVRLARTYPRRGVDGQQGHLRCDRVSRDGVVGPVGDYDVGAGLPDHVSDVADHLLARQGDLVVVAEEPDVGHPQLGGGGHKLIAPLLDQSLHVRHVAGVAVLVDRLQVVREPRSGGQDRHPIAPGGMLRHGTAGVEDGVLGVPPDVQNT